MAIELIFILAVGLLIAWCGDVNPTDELRRLTSFRMRGRRLPARPRLRLRLSTDRMEHPGGRRRSQGPLPAPASPSQGNSDTALVSDAEWNELIAGLSDLADLDQDVD